MNKHLLISFGKNLTSPLDANVASFSQNLNSVTERVGVKTALSEHPEPEPWPDTLLFSLRARIGRHANEYAETNKVEKRYTDISTRKLKIEEIKKKYRVHEIDQIQFFHQAIYGTTPVRERFVHFWLNHLTVGGEDSTNYVIGDYIQKIIDPGLSGHFSDLLHSAITHVGMLSYLDNNVNIGENSAFARKYKNKFQIGLNDNLARELLELHSVSPAKNYTESDIRSLAKILAGWWPYSLFNETGLKKINDLRAPFSEEHAEPGEKLVLGKNYGPGRKSLKAVTDDLAHDKSAAKFLSYKLCRHFLSDEPSDKHVKHVESVWHKTDGHLPDVHEAVLELTFEPKIKKFQSPLTWFFSMQRLSSANLVHGWEDCIEDRRIHGGVYRPRNFMDEMGQNYWSRRQPDGFSALSTDWISSEHMERRIRLASMTYQFGAPKTPIEEIIEFIKPSTETIKLINSTSDERKKFVMFFCSKEIMGV